MYLNNTSFDKKRRLISTAAAIILGICVPVCGVLIFDGMLRLSKVDTPIASSNEPSR